MDNSFGGSSLQSSRELITKNYELKMEVKKEHEDNLVDVENRPFSILLDPKEEPLETGDTKIPVNLDSINIKEISSYHIETYSLENVVKNVESGIDNELFEDSKVDVLAHGLKKEVDGFKFIDSYIPEDKIKRDDVMCQEEIKFEEVTLKVEKGCFDHIEESCSNTFSRNNLNNKEGVVNFPEDGKIIINRKKFQYTENLNNQLEQDAEFFKSSQEKQNFHKSVNKRNLKELLEKHHPNEKQLYECEKCHKKVASKQILDDHILTQHSDYENVMNTITNKIHYCKMCEYKTVNLCRFKRHQEKHHGIEADKQFKCYMCDYKTIYKYNFNCHVQSHTNLKSISCQLCNKHFKTKLNLDGHIVAKHSMNKYAMEMVTRKIHSCEVCEFKTVIKNDLKSHKMTHVDVETYKTFPCDTSGHKSSLESHSRKHIEPQTFCCPVCDKVLKKKKYLDYHIVALHSKNKEAMSTVTSKVHSCDVCEHKSVNGNKLKLHKMRHVDVETNKKFQCDMCGYKTLDKNILRTHIQRHMELRTFSCQVCTKSFNFKQYLDRHILAKHPKDETALSTVTCKVHSCEMCEYRTTVSKYFKLHLKKH